MGVSAIVFGSYRLTKYVPSRDHLAKRVNDVYLTTADRVASIGKWIKESLASLLAKLWPSTPAKEKQPPARNVWEHTANLMERGERTGVNMEPTTKFLKQITYQALVPIGCGMANPEVPLGAVTLFAVDGGLRKFDERVAAAAIGAVPELGLQIFGRATPDVLRFPLLLAAANPDIRRYVADMPAIQSFSEGVISRAQQLEDHVAPHLASLYEKVIIMWLRSGQSEVNIDEGIDLGPFRPAVAGWMKNRGKELANFGARQTLRGIVELIFQYIAFRQLHGRRDFPDVLRYAVSTASMIRGAGDRPSKRELALRVGASVVMCKQRSAVLGLLVLYVGKAAVFAYDATRKPEPTADPKIPPKVEVLPDEYDVAAHMAEFNPLFG